MSPRATGRGSSALTIFLVAAPLAGFAYVASVPGIGLDATALRACLETLAEGDNPYLMQEVRRHQPAWLSCTFQPLALRLAAPLLLVPLDAVAWLVLPLGVAVLLGVLRFVEPGERGEALALFSAGFAGWPVVLVTGNVMVLVEFAAVFALVRAAGRGNVLGASFALVLLAFWKGTPALFALPLGWWLWRRGETRALARAAVFCGAFFLALNAASAAVGSGIFVDYYRSILGLVPGQHSPTQELLAGATNPAPVFFLANAFARHGWAAGLLVGAGFAALVWRLRGVLGRRFLDGPGGLPFLLLATAALMPRLKPYFFLPLACLLFFCLRELDARRRIAGAVLFGLLPLLSLTGVKLGIPGDSFAIFLANHHQALFLLLALGVVHRWLEGEPLRREARAA